MMTLRSHTPKRLQEAINQGFIWATGIEDTFIAMPDPRTGRILDEYQLTEHYDRWREDLGLIAELGVRYARYGIPWYRVQPKPDQFDWSWTDQVLEHMVQDRGITPIIDLVHYGTPLWLDESFLAPEYPEVVSRYAAAFAEHYKGLCFWYTPLNEPRINAWYCGRLRRWPPYASGWKGFLRVLFQIARGICLTQQAILRAEPEAVFVHVDASDLYFARDSSDSELQREASMRQEIVYLALECVLGRLGDSSLLPWIREVLNPDPEIRWFQEYAVVPDVIGFNMYPMFSHKEIVRNKNGKPAVRIRPCGSEELVQIARDYERRYHGIPLMVTETSAKGSMKQRVRWIHDSTRALLQARDGGLPLIGYTLWPLFSIYAWAVQTGVAEIDTYLLHIGLWDLQRTPEGLSRIRTPAADAFQSVVASSGAV